MSTSIEIASVPTADTPGTCLYVRTEKRAYVFGRPSEGTQRAMNARRVTMGATEQIFLSGSLSWNQIGGLYGFVLTVGNSIDATKTQFDQTTAARVAKGLKTVQRSVNSSLGIHGGDNLCHTLAACRTVILRQPVSVSTFEHREDQRVETPVDVQADWEDDGLRVWNVPVRRNRSSSPQKRRAATPDNDDTSSSEDTFKPAQGPSDPTLARVMVEKAMFNGRLGDTNMIPKQVSLIKSTDTAFVRNGKNLTPYTGPFADTGAEIPNPEEIVWVMPSKDHVADRKANKWDTVLLTATPLPRTTYSELSMSYVVKCHNRRGKFDPAAAKKLGVKPQDFKILTSGCSVEGANGVTVSPEMVLGASTPGKGFIVADIESRDFLDSFMDRPEWSNPDLMSDIVSMYWILGAGMANDVRIQKFVRDYPKIKHIFCATDTCPNMISLSGPAELQTKLRRIDPERFNLLKYDNTVKGVLPEGPQVSPGRAGYKIGLMPRLDLDAGQAAPFPNLLSAASEVTEPVLSLAREALEKTSDLKFLRQIEEDEKDIPNRDAEIIPLGTGSSCPGKYRNVSATLIRVPGLGNYLLDCGEGTLNQIKRLFGDEETTDILRDLRCIAISHLHADHHLGAPSLIKAWYETTINDNDAKLAISCIWRYRTLLEEVSQVEDIGFHRLSFVNCPLSGEIPHATAEKLGDGNFGLASVKRIPVTHCWRSDAVQLELTSGLRIAYSGDCRPSDDFARQCHGAHLLIHECTFDDDMEHHAVKKQHSTMKEALDVASKMGARRTLLTHFSQRYVKSETIKRDDANAGKVLMAFDHMRVRLGDFQKAAAFQPAILKMLAEAS
ncbi:beta-lactamase-like protein [Dactylonectria estremocensis]|uniref:ribonuclease Z n=1 Tax=Dactylonectria estremocensis TaxID=1079267 RepID=A0A9P9FIT7_9HYPO|nr:beta-lactamase-like protein [Dactylonectria estremocensis]